MLRSFSYSLLITCFLLVISCKTNYVPTSFKTVNVSVSEKEAELDSSLVTMYLPFKKELEKDMHRVISISEKEMVKDKPESYLTNFLADLLLEEAKKEVYQSGHTIEPSISYFNYGGIRTYLPQGEITVGKIFELMPFENELVYLQLTGSQVNEFLNYVASVGGDSVGGVRFEIAKDKAKNIKICSNKIDPNKKYWIATNDYVAEGGDGINVFTKRLQIVKSGKKLRDIVINSLEQKHNAGEVLNVELDGRIKNAI